MFDFSMMFMMGKAVARDSYREALAYRDAGRIDEAIEACEKAITFDLKFYPAYTLCGSLYADREDWVKAGSYFKKAYHYAENSPGEALNLAHACCHSTPPCLEKAFDYYTKAIQGFVRYYRQFKLIVCPREEIKNIHLTERKSRVMVLTKVIYSSDVDYAWDWQLFRYTEDTEDTELFNIDSIPTLLEILEGYNDKNLKDLTPADLETLSQPIKCWLKNQDMYALQRRAAVLFEMRNYEAALTDLQQLHERLLETPVKPPEVQSLEIIAGKIKRIEEEIAKKLEGGAAVAAVPAEAPHTRESSLLVSQIFPEESASVAVSSEISAGITEGSERRIDEESAGSEAKRAMKETALTSMQLPRFSHEEAIAETSVAFFDGGGGGGGGDSSDVSLPAEYDIV